MNTKRKKMFKRMFIILLSLILIVACAYAYSTPYDDPARHIGVVCIVCHAKFSIEQPYAPNLTAPVKNPSMIKMTPCDKRTCHSASKRVAGGAERGAAIHMQKKVCGNCHANMHEVHREEVKCEICHMSYRGWNSSVATIPAPKKEQFVSFEGREIFIPEDDDCSKCHLDGIGATRLHDVHKRVLNDNCIKCHEDIITQMPNVISKTTGAKLPEEMEKWEIFPVTELSRLFNEIAMSFLALVVSV